MLTNSEAFSGFAVDKIDVAHRFYTEILGLKVTEEHGMLWLQIEGGNEVFVYPKDEHTPAGHTVLNFPVDDIEKTVDDLSARDVTFERFPGIEQDGKGIARGGGPLIAWFTDPAGNVMSVIQKRNPSS